MTKRFLLILLCACFHAYVVPAQVNSQAPDKDVYRVAIFAPAYLDSLFSGNTLKNEKVIPAFAMAGLDFIQGAEIALDTINLEGKKVETYIYDSKSVREPLVSLLKSSRFDHIDLIIGSVKEPEYSYLARFAQQRGVPFVSATYPNDGEVRQNPYLVIVNPTLKVNCESIFSYIMQRHGTDNIYLVKQKNDNRIANYFRDINFADGKPLLKIKTISLDSSISPAGLRYLIDTTRPCVIIGATLYETFAKKLADAIYPIQKNNKVYYIGMPNWDGFSSLYQADAYPDFPIRYTSPHYVVKDSSFITYLDSRYFKTYRAHPSDMASKGFEITYYFVSLLLKDHARFMQELNDTSLAVFHDFNFQPAFHSKSPDATPDYQVNKHLFMMQILNGETVREW